MALQVWLPLNSGLNNQGLNNGVTITGTAVYSSTGSPIGGCYNFTTGQNITISGFDFSKLTNASISVWVKQTTLVNTVFFTGPSTSHYIIAANTNGTSNIYHSNNIGSNVKTMYVDGEVGTKLGAAGQWHHYTITGLNLSSWTGTALKFNSYSANYNFAGSVCDIRIYDHCLSAKEVKEISKALVLHYKLDETYGMTNILSHSINYVYNNYGALTATAYTGEYYNGVPIFRTTHTPSSATSSNFYAKSLGGRGKYTNQRITYSANTKYVYWTYYKVIQPQGIVVGGVASNIGGWTEIKPVYIGDGWYRVGQYRDGSVTTDKIDNIFTSYHCNDLVSEGDSVIIDWAGNFLLTGTTTIPENFVDGNSVVHDCSGYGNDGTIGGSPKPVSGSPRYENATSLEGSSFINAGRGSMVTDALTVSAWAWLSSWAGSNGRIASCTESGGWNFENGSGYLRFPVYAGGYALATDTLPLSSYSNGWHHIVGTFDGPSKKSCFYRDGQFIASATTTNSAMTYYSNNSVFIGAEAAASQTTPQGTYFNGAVSDFRIYGTALSPEDVAELYHTAASVDNKGNFYCYELKEM